ncbi:hypothetical protein G6F37_006744 [Rhizopus arrhizus]|nr:hypothetical protein G6F38_012430 [Rhizopus arrhizus]KAG1157385.1 hypothetical protein G6F37_006744 [Rhizopus arrhizus]
MYKFIQFIAIFVTIFSLQQVHADGTCAAQANFDKCKEIQTSLLSTCGPVDYKCQCDAQNLILLCYGLCTNYASEASIQKSVAQGICAAVPSSSSSLLVPSSTSKVNIASITASSPSNSAATGLPHVKQNNESSSANRLYPASALVIICIMIDLFQL